MFVEETLQGLHFVNKFQLIIPVLSGFESRFRWALTKDRDLLLIDVLHNVFDMQRMQSQNIHIKSCFIYFIPLVSFCTPQKHQKTSAFLIYRVFTGIGLSTVGYLRDLCSRLLMKRRGQIHVRELLLQKAFLLFANERKCFCAACCKRDQKWDWHD